MADDLNDAEPLFQDGLLDQAIQKLGMVNGSPSHKYRPGRYCQFGYLEFLLDMNIGGRRGTHAIGSGGGVLASGHAVDAVVDDDGR